MMAEGGGKEDMMVAVEAGFAMHVRRDETRRQVCILTRQLGGDACSTYVRTQNNREAPG